MLIYSNTFVQNILMKNIVALTFLLINTLIAFGQQDSLRRPLSFSGLPVVSSSPETGFKYGAFGQVTFDLMDNNLNSRASQVSLGITYSVKKQLSIGSDFIFFGKDEKYIVTGYLDYKNWIDRHYGNGNDASILVYEYDTEAAAFDTLNYVNYGVDFFSGRVTFNKKIKNNLFIGASLDAFSANNFQLLADSTFALTDEIVSLAMVGQYYGIGFNAIYDTRKYINNPIEATYIQLSNRYYGKVFGADFKFTTLELDMRQYFNWYKDQVFAVRLLTTHIFSESLIPFNALPKLGGSRIGRGYYQGTYLGKNALSLDIEYRIPLFNDNSAPTWKFWKHLGLTVFMSSGKVYDELSEFGDTPFRLSAGAGLRIKLSKAQRTNIRLDYGFGLHEDANGQGKKQRGLYITVNEAF